MFGWIVVLGLFNSTNHLARDVVTSGNLSKQDASKKGVDHNAHQNTHTHTHIHTHTTLSASPTSMAATTPRRRNGRPRERVRRTRTRPNKTKARKWQTLARKRGIQRWSSLVTATSSRLAKTHGMRQLLGERCWRDFVKHATTHYREAFLRAFTPQDGVLRCRGPLEPTCGSACACPQSFRVDVRQLASSNSLQRDIATSRLKLMHVDHTYDVQHICDTWKSLSEPAPPRWDHGVCAQKLCQLLFGIDPEGGKACLTFRCAVLTLNTQQPCHHVARPHYAHTLQASQVQ